jgi:hypothetical protein
VVQSTGAIPTDERGDAYDRFVSNFVLDLLSRDDIRAVVSQAARMLEPGGLLCVASLSPAHGPVSRCVIGAWSLVHRASPALVGGCRPIRLTDFLGDEDWRVVARDALSPFGLPLEAVVVERRSGSDSGGVS